MKRKFFRVSTLLLLAGMLSFSFVATSCGDDDDDPVEQVQEFTITYDANGGSGTVAPTKFKPGAQITLSDGSGLTAPEGKVFAGWSTSKDKEELDVTKITGNTTLYAVWKDAGEAVVTEITISYDANGGTGTIEPTKIKAGEKFTISDGTGLTAPEGKVFAGWSTSKDKEEFDETKITADITLYAVWKDASVPAVEEVTITIDFGDGQSTTIKVDKGAEFKAEDYAALTPNKEGYTFKGWATEKDGEVKESVTVTEAITLYAIWEKNAENTEPDNPTPATLAYETPKTVTWTSQWSGPSVSVEADWAKVTVVFEEAPAGVQFCVNSDYVVKEESYGKAYQSTYPAFAAASATVDIAKELADMQAKAGDQSTKVTTITVQNVDKLENESKTAKLIAVIVTHTDGSQELVTPTMGWGGSIE